MIILSLIIPNYNGILFLESCITSVTSQLLDNVEVIFIDDGSTDNSVNFINNKFLNYIILFYFILFLIFNKIFYLNFFFFYNLIIQYYKMI